MSTAEPERTPGTDEDPFEFLKQPPKDNGAIKSRALGVFLLLVGGGMLAWAEFGNWNWMPKKVFFALVSLGPAVLWMGIGLIVFPLTGKQFATAFGGDQGFREMWRNFPPIWRVWFALTLVVMAAGFVYAIKVAG
jgi:hypothetical protein